RPGGNTPVTETGPTVVPLRPQTPQPPHNDYLRAFVELGFVGLVAFVGLLAALIALAVTAHRRAVGPRARTISLAFVGVISGYVVASVAANLLGQVVLLWYVFALAASAAWVARHGAVADDATGEPSPAGPVRLVAAR